MATMSAYKPRPIRFMGIEHRAGWDIKLYSISNRSEFVAPETLDIIRKQITPWLEITKSQSECVYHVATLIAHEGREGNFAILSWWTEENMLRLYAYLAKSDNSQHFELISDKGIITCVWEMAIHWFERNAWVRCVLSEPANPLGVQQYLQQHYSTDI